MTAGRRPIRSVAAAVLVGCLAFGCSDAPGDDSGSSPTAAESPATGDRSPGQAQPTEGSATPKPEEFDPHTLADDPRELATRIAAAEDTARDPAAPEEQASAAAFELQVLYRQASRQPRWEDRVRRQIPRRLRPVLDAHLAARRDLRSMHTTLSDTLPAWRIVAPAPAAELRRYYREGQRRFNVPWEVLAAINLVETGMGRIRGTSSAGAQGPMQFIPETWARFGRGDVEDPRDAILAAARYLAHNGGGSGQLDRALYSYNNHPAYVRAVRSYASLIEADPRAYRGLYHWQIIYLSAAGDVWLPVGYERAEPVKVRRYLREHPDRRLSTDTG